MSGSVITKSTGLKCVHAPGPTPDITYPRVKIEGQPIVLQGQPYTITTCGAANSMEVFVNGPASSFCSMSRAYFV